MAFKRPTSFITDPSEEESDYLAATTPVGPKYVAPEPDSPDAESPFGTSAPAIGQRSVPSGQPPYVDPDLDPNAYSPVNAPPKSAQLRQELEQLAKQRPSKEPGIWRTLAGIGAGIGVGYLTRNANMVANVQDRIMHPGQANWNNAWNDKTAEVEQQDKIEAGARAADKGSADIAHTQAETRNQNNQADWYNKPDAPKAPTPVTEKVQVVGPDGKKKTEIHYIPDPNHPEKYSVLGTPPSVESGPKTEAEMRRAAYMTAHDGQEPDETTVASWARPTGPRTKDDWIAIASDPKATPELQAQAKKALQLHTDQALASRPERPVNESAQKNQAINAAFQDSGNDWNKVLDNVRAGKYQNYAGDIADHAAKMTKLGPDAQRKVTAADTTVQQVQSAIDAIDEITKAHPDLTGDALHHPWNAGNRKVATFFGSEPADVGAADSILETAAALQPGQHNFRSIGALAEFKKALGIDPRTGKSDGSRAWLVNPEKAKAALKAVADFNQRLKENTLSAAGNQGVSRTAAPVAAPAQGAPTTVMMKAPNGQVSPVPANQVEHFKAQGAVVVQQ